MMTAISIMISQMKNKWRLKNEAKLKKLYDTKSNHSKVSDTGGKPQNGRKVSGRTRL